MSDTHTREHPRDTHTHAHTPAPWWHVSAMLNDWNRNKHRFGLTCVRLAKLTVVTQLPGATATSAALDQKNKLFLNGHRADWIRWKKRKQKTIYFDFLCDFCPNESKSQQRGRVCSTETRHGTMTTKWQPPFLFFIFYPLNDFYYIIWTRWIQTGPSVGMLSK